MRRAHFRIRAAGAVLLLFVLTAMPAQRPAGSLASLRLLPPVLIKGENGWTLEERMHYYKIEGVSVAVFGDYRILWEEAAGLADREEQKPATPETLFQAGSISKPVATAGVLRKVQDGTWALDRPINDYLKSWKVPEGQFTLRKVTLERLLSHTAGLTVHGFPGYEVGQPVPTVPQVLDGAQPANTAPVRVDIEPGTRYRYSGGGYTVAQLAMTDTFGRPFPELMAELVLKPAGMRASTYQQPLPPDKLRLAAAGYRSSGIPVAGKRHTYPEMAAAGLWTTAGDLARFAIAVQKSLRGADGSLLSKETAERMVKPVLGDYALGLGIEKHGEKSYFGHGGADEGFQALLLASMDGSCGAAVMVNSDNGISLANEIIAGIAHQYGWKGYLPDPLDLVDVSAEQLTRLSGRYQLNGDEALKLEARGKRLFGIPSMGEEYELYPIKQDLFVRKDRGTRCQIEMADGKIIGLALLNEGQRIAAKRMVPGGRLPIDDLSAGRIEKAVQAYKALHAANPKDAGVAEERLNRLGYDLLGRKEYARAVSVLRLNAELYPSSSNSYDSLGEAYLASGDRTRALESYRQVLVVLPKDNKADAGLKDQLRRNADAKIRELSR